MSGLSDKARDRLLYLISPIGLHRGLADRC